VVFDPKEWKFWFLESIADKGPHILLPDSLRLCTSGFIGIDLGLLLPEVIKDEIVNDIYCRFPNSASPV